MLRCCRGKRTCVAVRVLWIHCCSENSVCLTRLETTYLTIWTVVRRPFWPICPGRRCLSGGGPTSLGGYSSAHSSHSPLKCWMPAGERQVRGVLQKVGPPPWALPLLSPSGTGHLCCSLQQMIKQEDNHWLDSDWRDSTFIHDLRLKILLYSQNRGYCDHFEDIH